MVRLDQEQWRKADLSGRERGPRAGSVFTLGFCEGPREKWGRGEAWLIPLDLGGQSFLIASFMFKEPILN